MKRPRLLRCYVASKFENVGPVRAIQALVREAGMEITHDWTPAVATSRDLAPDALEAEQRKGAILDMRGVFRADLFTLLPYQGMKGAFVELGMALAECLDVWVVGDRTCSENVFFHLRDELLDFPLIDFFPTIDDFKARLAEYVIRY